MIDAGPHSGNNRFRAARILALLSLVRDHVARKGSCSILDVGGTQAFWATWGGSVDWDSVSLTCLNRRIDDQGDGRIAFVEGDARDLSRYRDGAFDVVFSNSVIEHVGGWNDMLAMARGIRRVGRSYFVQTPYFWFPMEPHARTPFVHWLPESLAYRIILARKTRFWGRPADVHEAVWLLQSSRLVDARQFAALFPDAEIRRERFLGLTKSLVAVRRGEAVASEATVALPEAEPEPDERPRRVMAG